MAAEVAIRITADGKAVVTAAKQAEVALEGIGAQADKTATALKGTTQSSAGLNAAMQQLDRSGQAGGLPSYVAQLDAINARQAQATQALHASAAGLGAVGVSASQTNAALRMMPAQITDIVTSLAGGQNPLLVLIQQGGQIKDAFGGIGNTFKVLGGEAVSFFSSLTGIGSAGGALAEVAAQQQAIAAGSAEAAAGMADMADGANHLVEAAQNARTGLTSVAPGVTVGMVVGFVAVAAALAALAVAIYQGSEELGAFQNAATMSGNAVGLSSSQFGAMTQSLSSIAGTRGQAAEALTEIARTGRLAGAEIENIAAAAILMEKATGQAIADTVAEFVKLADEPVKASLALNKQYNYLTAAVYEQIKALDEQGNKLGAAELAEKTYAEALKARASTVIDNAGLMERAWRGITGAAKGAWDAMLGVGREASLQDKLAAVGKEIAKAQGPFNASAFGDGNAEAKAKLQTNLQLQASLQEMVRLEKRGTEAANERNQVQLAGVSGVEAVTKANEKALPKQKQMEKALDDYRKSLADVRASNPGSELLKAKTIADTEKGIREQYESSAAGKEAAKSTRDGAAANREAAKAGKEAEKAYNDLVKTAQTLANAKNAEAESINAWFEAEEKARLATVKAANDSVQAAQDEYDNYGRTKSQIAEVTLARLQDKLQGVNAGTEIAASIGLQIEAQQRLIGILQKGEVREAGVQAAKDAADEWKKTADSIENSLTDALLRGFESGKGFGKNLRDTLVNMFKTLVLRPIISAVMSPVSQAIGGTLGLSGAANASTGGGLSSLSGISNLYSAASSIAAVGSQVVSGTMSLANALGTIGANATGTGISGLLATNGAYGTAAAGTAGGLAGGVSAAIAAIPGWGWAALAAAAAYSLLSGKKDVRNGGGYTINAGQAQAVYGGGPDKSFTGDAAIAGAITATSDSINNLFKSVGSAAVLATYYGASETSNKGRGGVMSGGALANGVRFGEDGTGSNYDGTYFERSSTQSPDGATAAANLATDLKQSIVQALQAADDLPASMAKLVKGVNAEALSDADVTALLAVINAQVAGVAQLRAAMLTLPFKNLRALSFDAASGLAAAAGGFEALGANLSSYYDNFYSDAEKRLQTIQAIDKATQGSGLNAATATRASYRALMEAQDVATESGQKMYAALLGASGAFASITTAVDAVGAARGDLIASYEAEASAMQSTVDRFRTFAGDLRGFRDSLLTGALSPLTPGQRYAETTSQFDKLLAATQGGTEAERAAAYGQLQGASTALLEASRTYNASGSGYLMDFDRVREALGSAAIGALASADVAQLQLDALNGQLGWLKRIDESVLSVSSALARYTERLGKLSAEDPVEGLYASLLGRESDAGGKAYWEGQMAAGSSLAEITAAIKDSPEYISVHGSHASGLSRVPFDGYIAELHAGERVLTAQENGALSRMDFSSYGAGHSDNAELVAEIRALHQEVRTLREQNNQGHAVSAEATVTSSAKNAEVITTRQSKATFNREPTLS